MKGDVKKLLQYDKTFRITFIILVTALLIFLFREWVHSSPETVPTTWPIGAN